MATPAPNNFKNPVAVAKAALSAAASVTTAAVVVHSVVEPFLPPEFQGSLFSGIRSFLSRFSSEMTMVINQYEGMNPNEIFQAAQVYLPAKQLPSMRRVRVAKPLKGDDLTLALDQNQVLVDTYEGIKLKWVFASRQVNSGNRGLNSSASQEVEYFELTFHKKHEKVVRESYLPFIMSEAKPKENQEKKLKLFTASFDDGWTPVNLDHPATFDTVAMDLELKEKLIDDLDSFMMSKDYYRKVGKVWKRGYLFYGPPGTGKSSLVAAMANHLKFDVYDLELSGIQSDAELRRLLVSTRNRSILVVEDIDCIGQLQDRTLETPATGMNSMSTGARQVNQVTLSGFLNFIDGLWSSCGDERIIVFTTNHRDKLDPALLRPGRMDLHIPMSYCTPCGFKALALNYLDIDRHEIDRHKLFNLIKSLLMTARVTPAEVAEQLLHTARVTSAEVAEQLLKSNKVEAALRDMVTFLANPKRKENEEKVRRSQLVEENGGSQEESSECELIEK